MINIFVYYYLMFSMFVFLFIVGLGMYYIDYIIIMEWLFISCNSINIEMLIFVDWISLLFISFIFLISSIIIIYRFVYIEGEKFIVRFVYLVVFFIASIVFIIISPNVFRILFGWDGLGLVSYCLVIFYQNYMSYNSGMVTVLCNRVGDVGLLISISLIIIKGRWRYWILSGDKLLIFILLLAAIRKRAQIPFSTWLPMAIAAPTPVSALVHSSTLVTAGVYLIIRFNKFLFSRGMRLVLLFLSVLTMFISGFMAVVENDLKKIIALSTLRQLGLIIIILRLGIRIVAFYHLLVHAIFKSMLFMCAGIIIHLILNNQDIRFFGNLRNVIPFTIIRFYISRLALCGFPFMAGFYSKDFIIELLYRRQLNLILIIIIVVSLMFTVIYSIRLFYYIFFNNVKFYSYYNFKEENLLNLSMIVLVIIRIFIGAVLNWLFFYDFYNIYLKVGVKILTLGRCFIGLIVGVFLMLTNFINKFYYLNFYLGSMWYLNYLYLWIYKEFNRGGVKFIEVDNTWVEFKFKNFTSYLIKYFNIKLIYKMYIFIFVFIYLFILIYLLF